MEDLHIIELYFARDEEAIRHTADKYGPYCTAVSMSILHSEPDAEECVNDTWLKTWNSIPPTRPNSLKLFLARITRNLSINRHRALHSDKRNKDLEVSLSELEPCFPAPDDLNGGGGELVELLNRYFMIRTANENKQRGCIYCGRTGCRHFKIPREFKA